MITRIIINDISFGRFCKELIDKVKKYPNAKLIGYDCGDSAKAENAFMFTAVLEAEKEEELILQKLRDDLKKRDIKNKER